MPILYSTVARGTTVLACQASCRGNFNEVVEQVLMKITPENAKLTYSNESYLFHYITDDRIVYLCITDDEFERSRAFAFLSEVKRSATELELRMYEREESFHNTGPALEEAPSPTRFLEDDVRSRVPSIADLVTGPDNGAVFH
ncbi:putative vesicle-associated membrane protein 7 isoform X2 [Apostichopus japonicus]|uniref:Putative vesicle-associated membrane protein 7 isoform X2 n=1 Tax=Stichopus japonicus TaxID=307972 RepID=A0A2G8LLQ5_STIJA|nr:putative vesicle-associated membrane protein 7 isoform X2 [Apostichopus japonicus]